MREENRKRSSNELDEKKYKTIKDNNYKIMFKTTKDYTREFIQTIFF